MSQTTKPTQPAIFPCGCSWMKVSLGRCDDYAPNGERRGPSAIEVQHGDPIPRFKAEIEEVCKRHGLSIGHEDHQGAFLITKYEGNEDPLFHAYYATEK